MSQDPQFCRSDFYGGLPAFLLYFSSQLSPPPNFPYAVETETRKLCKWSQNLVWHTHRIHTYDAPHFFKKKNLPPAPPSLRFPALSRSTHTTPSRIKNENEIDRYPPRGRARKGYYLAWTPKYPRTGKCILALRRHLFEPLLKNDFGLFALGAGVD